MRLMILLCLIGLAACARPMREMEVPVVAEEAAAVSEPVCESGDDDGIGGTGCTLD